MQYHLTQIKAFCDIHPIDAKVLIVPTMTVGHDLAIALAATGYSYLNLQIETPRSLAEKDVSAHLITIEYSRMAQDADLFWLDEMIPQAVSEVNDDYFAQQATALTRPFLRTLRVLRAAGLEPDLLSAKGLRHRVLQRLYQTYSATFERDNLYDNAVLYRHALKHLKSPPQNTHYAILDETPLPKLAFDYLCEKTKGYICRIGREDMGVSPPPHSAAKRFEKVPYPTATGKIGVGGKIFKSGLDPIDTSQIQLCETLGTETEISTVLRDIRSGTIPLDTVEIAYTSEMPYMSLLCDAVQRYALPATFAEGIPISTTRTGRALVNFYRWVGAGYPSDELVMMCRAGLIASESAPAIATTLQQAHIGEGEGPRPYFIALNQIKANMQDRETENSETDHRGLSLEEIEAVEEELKRLFALIPKGPNVSLDALVDAGLQFLEHYGNAEDEVLTAIRDRLHHVAQSVRRKAPARRLANRLSELITNLSFKAEAAKPGHLSIAPLSRAGYTNRAHIYITGMDEATFPGGATEDPILLDGERSGVSGELELRRTRPAEQVWHLIRVLGMASNKVTLLSCHRSLSDSRERYPAALFQQAAEQMNINPVIVPSLPENSAQALDDAEALIAHYPSADYESVVHRTFPYLVTGQKARQNREWSGLTTYDGWLGETTSELAITAQHDIISPSKLEMLARCPYRYFLNHVLEIQPIEKVETDPTRWLDPLSYGALLHALFHKFMQLLKARGERPDRERHGTLIQELLQKEIEAKKETHPVEHEAAYRADVKRLLHAAQVFLSVESDQKNTDPIGFEVSFGFGESGGLNSETPVTLELAEDVAFRIRGRIDRVDRVENEIIIWDYKTGSMAQY
ncbi:MAG: PD-(D/E)XK nuclease family protein, partial [Gemmatimonadetes bacterium]|nr:PD-(D/E)XK nuclease family protein [Gemmatimonadota bacterium]